MPHGHLKAILKSISLISKGTGPWWKNSAWYSLEASVLHEQTEKVFIRFFITFY